MGDSIDALIRKTEAAIREAKKLRAKKAADGSLGPPPEAPEDFNPHRATHAVAEADDPEELTDLDEGVPSRKVRPPYVVPAATACNRKIMQYLDWLKGQTRTALMSHWYDAFKEPPPHDRVSRDWLICGLVASFRMTIYGAAKVEAPPQGYLKHDFESVRSLLLIGDGINGHGDIYPEPTGREEFHAPKYLRLIALVNDETAAFTGKRQKKHHILASLGAKGASFKELTFYLERLCLGGKGGPEKEAKRMFTRWVKAGWCKTTLPEGAPQADKQAAQDEQTQLETVVEEPDETQEGEEE